MSDSENAAFWLPSHILTDDDFLSDYIPSTKDDYIFSNSALDSPVSSTETERGDSNIDERHIINEHDDEFLAELTRHLAHSSLQDSSPTEKPWMFSTSPQSTLTGFGPWSNRSGFSSNGSPNGPSPRVLSPPVTPTEKDPAWELLYEAAGQVARLKMNALAAQINHNRGLLAAPRNVSLPSKANHHHHHHRQLNSFYDFPHTTAIPFEQGKRQGNGNFYCHHNHHQQRRTCGGAPLGLPQSAWPSLRPNHHQHQHRQPNNAGPGMRAVYLNGPGPGSIKRQSTGTGVFLPRQAKTTTTAHHHQPLPEYRKKPAVVPVPAFNMDFEEINNVNSHSRFGSGLLSDHEIIMARRSAIMEARRNVIRNEAAASTMVGHEIRLPSDWTY